MNTLYEVFTAVTVHIVVWVVMPYSVVYGYQYFGGNTAFVFFYFLLKMEVCVALKFCNTCKTTLCHNPQYHDLYGNEPCINDSEFPV
jgi:hypothetical protein